MLTKFTHYPFISNRVKQHRDYIEDIFTSSINDIWGSLLSHSPLEYVGFIERDDGSAAISLDVPGIKSNDIELSCDKNTLTVKGERKDGNKYSKLHTSFTLPKGYDPDTIKASLEDGVMTISVNRLPVEKTEARKIPIENSAVKLLGSEKETEH